MSTGPQNMERLRLEAIERRRVESADLIDSRKRKLSELYTVSNLSRIREIDHDDLLKPIKENLLSFLEKNDLQKGHEFVMKTLQESNAYTGPALKLRKQESSSQSDHHTVSPQTQSSQPSSQPQSHSQSPVKPVIQVATPIDTTQQNVASPEGQIPRNQTSGSPVQNQAAQQSQSNSISQQAEPQLTKAHPQIPQAQPSTSDLSISVPGLNEQSPTKDQIKDGLQSDPKATQHSQEQNAGEQQEGSSHAGPQDQVGQPSVQAIQQSSSQSQAETPAASTTVKEAAPSLSNRQNVIRKRNKEDKVSLYDPQNQEAIDTHVLLLKEQLPARVSEATPLAELYYLAQTLPLVKLMPSTHKVVTSTMYETALTEGKINVVHSRIEELKRQGKWSLKQPTKFQDPIRGKQKTHWDHLLSEMNWMATDFREERKLKIATCAFIAQSISDYWNYGKICCVKRKPITHLETQKESEDLEVDVFEEQNEDSIDISKLLKRPDPSDEIKPVQLSEFTEDDFKKFTEEESQSPFKLNLTMDELNDQNRTLLDEMPAFQSFEKYDDKYDNLPLIPVSKSLIPIEDDTWYNVLFKQIVDDSNYTPPQQKGLFGFSSQKKINTSIKPPSPPSLKYLDLRTPTIWLPEDDQNLIEYVNKFSFNWGVVSAHLSKKPTRSYASNIERRTPWQCFERYIQLNDTFQINDMRGQNFMSATKWLEHAHNIQATTKRRISPLGVGVDSIQRGHKRLRWASMFEAVRKCMRKRESVTRPNNNQVRKSADDKKLAAPTPAELSKLKFERDKSIQEAYLQNSANGFRTGVPQPGTANAAVGAPSTARSDNQQPSAPTSAGNSNALPAQRPASQSSSQLPNGQLVPQGVNNPISRSNSSSSTSLPQQHQQGQVNQAQIPQNIPQQAQRSGIPVSNSNTAINNASAAAAAQRMIQSQSNGTKILGPNGVPYGPEQIHQMMLLRQRKLMQQQAQQKQQQGQPSQPQPPQAQTQGTQQLPRSQPRVNMNGLPQVSPSPNNLGNTQLTTGTAVNSPNMNSTSRANSNAQGSNVSSPLIGQSQPQQVGNSNNGNVRPSFVPAHVSAIINQIQSQNPNMSKQEVTKVAAQYLANLQAKQYRTNAINGNNGNNVNANNGNNMGSSPTPNNTVPVSQSRPASNQASPSGFSQAKVNASVPTPQQILQQQGVSSSPPLQSPRVQQVQPQQQQPVRQSPNATSQVPLQQTNQPSPSLTPQQKAQLDMLKVLHAEQQQKRQQQQQAQGQAQNRNGQQPIPQQQVGNASGTQQSSQQSPNIHQQK